MTLIVGLTGGIGSGKTLVSDRLAELGVPIIDTDVIARTVVEPGQPTLAKLVDRFGSTVLTEDGALNRDAMRHIAFSSKANKRDLDAITHPAIRAETLRQVQTVTYPYCVIVIPLLTADSAFAGFLQRIVTVSADTEVRIERVMARNGFTREQVLSILETQLTDEQRESFADDVVHNNGSKQAAREQADHLHQQYLDLSQISTRERR